MFLTLDDLDLTSEQRDQVDDHILSGRQVLAAASMRDAAGCSLKECIEVLGSRYEQLRRDRPGDFTVPHDTYWDGFYS